MADEALKVILEAEDEVTPIVGKANSALDNYEKKFTESHGKVIRITDQTRTSVQRLIASVEKQAEVYGKSGVEKLIVQRDQLLQRFQKEPAAIDAITRSYEKMIASEKKIQEARAAQDKAASGQATMGWISDPLGKLRETATGALTAIGPLGGAIAGITAGFVGLVTAGFEAAKSLGEYGMRVKDAELRTGLTAKEVGQFGFAARAAGQDISVFERMMRGLSEATDENSEQGKKARAELERMGVSLKGFNGEMRPTSQILEGIAEGLSRIPTTLERNAAAMALFKRAGIETIPVMLELSENLDIAQAKGYGPSEADVERFTQYQKEVAQLETSWDSLSRKLKEPLAATVLVAIKGATGDQGDISETIAKALRSRMTTTSPDQMQGLLDQAGASGFLSGPAYQRLVDEAQKEAAKGIGKAAYANGGFGLSVDTSAVTGRRHDVLGEQEELERLKKIYEEARKLPDVTSKHAAEVDKARDAYQRQSELVKELEKDESKRVSTLEKIRDLVRQGQTAYVIGTGADQAVVTGAEIAAANQPARRIPSLVRPGEFNPAAQAALELMLGGPQYAAGMQWVGNERAFVSPEAARDVYGKPETEQLTARMTGEIQEQEKAQKEQLSAVAAQASFMERMVQLRDADYGTQKNIFKKIQEEEDVARQVSGIRQAALNRELNLTGDVNKYREESLKNELDLRVKIAEEAQRLRDEELRETAELAGHLSGLFHTLLTDPQKFPKQLVGTVRESLIQPISKGLSGMTASLLYPVTSSVGGLFQGMFSSHQADPVKVSTDQNTTATMQNSAAILLLTAHLAAGMGMGTPTMPSVSGIVGASIPSISMPSVGGGIPSVSSSITYGSPASFGLGGGSANPMAMGGPGGGDILSNSWTRYMMGATFGGNGAGGSSVGVSSLFNRSGWSGLGAKFGIGQGTGAPQSVGLYGDTIAQGGVTTASSLLTSQGAASLYMAAGLPLGMAGLTGSRRGTWGGVAESTAGGALAGAGIGTMFAPGIGTAIGAGIGAAAGFGASVGEMLFGVKSLQQTAHDDVRSTYGVDIPVNSGTIKQIVGIATSQFGGSVSVAVRSPSVRQLVMLYSESTGQKMPLSATTPYGGSLVEQGGQVYQQASYQDGQAHLYASSLPTLGNIPGSTYPTPGGPNTSGGAGPISVALNINGTPITPGFVSDSYSEAQGASINRVQQAATLNVPGLMVA